MTAYIHQANRTIERVNREILKVSKSFLSQFRLPQESWPGVIPLVQNALNHASLPSIGGLAPITVFKFTGLPAQNPLAAIWRNDQEKVIETRKTAGDIRALTDSLRDALLEIHKYVTLTASRLRTQTRRKFENQKLPNFKIGDFVLFAAHEMKFPPKLRAKWTGPYRVVKTISNHVHQIEHLVHGEKRRLTFLNFDFTKMKV